MRLRFILLFPAGVCLLVLAPAIVADQGPSRVDALSPATDAKPVVADHRYRASGGVRPFVLFWINRDNVGGARITSRRTADGEFTVIYGMAGMVTAVPLRMIYRPRWWLRTEPTLDETMNFSAGTR